MAHWLSETGVWTVIIHNHYGAMDIDKIGLVFIDKPPQCSIRCDMLDY